MNRTLHTKTHLSRIAVVLGIETASDFSTRTEVFKNAIGALMLNALASEASTCEEFMAMPSVTPGSDGKSVADVVGDLSKAIGELVAIWHFSRIDITGWQGAYTIKEAGQ